MRRPRVRAATALPLTVPAATPSPSAGFRLPDFAASAPHTQRQRRLDPPVGPYPRNLERTHA
ncbi:MAG: hypothetical protein QOC85_241 [Streptomyces sp.]|nr:hypothetical protein [Streptomyces sp.]